MGNENSTNKGSIKNGKNVGTHANGDVNGLKVKSNPDHNEATSENAEKPNGELTIHNTGAVHVIVEMDGSNVKAQVNDSKDVPVIPTEAQKQEVPTSEVNTPHPNGEPKDDRAAEEAPSDPQPEPADIATKQDSETFEEPKSLSLDLKPVEGQTHNTDDQKSQPVERQEESDPDKNPVMNFFKTLVTPTKSQKKETATPDVTKDQPPKETPPTVTSTTVAQVPEPPAAPKGMSIPPPPPPEPPKMEIKGEPAVRPQKPTPKEGPKASAKQPGASKGKSTKDTLSNFFRSKQAMEEVLLPVVQVQDTVQDTVQDEPEPVLEVKETAAYLPHPVVEVQTVEEVVPQPVVVEVEVDASKTTTLEADVKPETAAPAAEEKKPPGKTSFFSLFKPKIQVAEPKKETAAPPAAAEAAHNMKAKEEPKAAPKTADASVENKPPSEAAQGGDQSAKAPKKLEKRNSINLFFKNLSQKRNSIDAGVQTEPAAPATASEKTK